MPCGEAHKRGIVQCEAKNFSVAMADADIPRTVMTSMTFFSSNASQQRR